MLAAMAGLLAYFSLGNQKHHLSVYGSVLKADHWLLSCHISSFSAVALISVSLMSQEVLTALFFSCRLFSKGESSVQPVSVLWTLMECFVLLPAKIQFSSEHSLSWNRNKVYITIGS